MTMTTLTSALWLSHSIQTKQSLHPSVGKTWKNLFFVDNDNWWFCNIAIPVSISYHGWKQESDKLLLTTGICLGMLECWNSGAFGSFVLWQLPSKMSLQFKIFFGFLWATKYFIINILIWYDDSADCRRTNKPLSKEKFWTIQYFYWH